MTRRVGRRWFAACVALVALTSAACKTEWTMFGHDVGHSGRATDTSISASNVASLGLAWRVDTGDAVYPSPRAGSDVNGRTIVVIGNQLGTLIAYDAGTGVRLWTYQTGGAISAA